MLPSQNEEEFIFYLDLVTDFLKKKTLTKAINAFIKEKDKLNALNSYGLVIFQKDENPINVYDLKDAETVLNTINTSWETRENEKSYFENGLYEILAYIFRKSREIRKNYRIIIISDSPSKLSEDYYNALYDLLIKAKKFSAFIDIIRVGEAKFFEDDVKLKVVSSETHGGTFYCSNEKHLNNILGSLTQNKKEFKIIKSEESEQILEEDKVFYERLAVDLISLSPEDQEICSICNAEVCPICEAHSDEIHKCFNCNTKFHSCCAAKYSLANNIGFLHIFRCPHCGTLLKLDQEFVDMIHEEELEEGIPEIELREPISEPEIEESEIQEEVIEEIIEEEEEELEEPIEPIEIPESTPSPEMKKVKLGGFFGQEITISTKDIKKDIIRDHKEEIIHPEEQISITTLKQPKRRRNAVLKLCKICGATIQRNSLNCPSCGARID